MGEIPIRSSKKVVDIFKDLIEEKIKKIISDNYNLFMEFQNSEFENNLELDDKINSKRNQINQIIQKFFPNQQLFPFNIKNRILLEKMEKKLDYYYKMLFYLSEIYEWMKKNYKALKYTPINNLKENILKTKEEDFLEFTNLIEEKYEICFSNDYSFNNASLTSSQIYSNDSSISEIIKNECFDNDFSDENFIEIQNYFMFNKEQINFFLSNKLLFYEKIIYIYHEKSQNIIYFFFYNKMLKFKIDKNNIIFLDYSKYFDLIIYEPELILDISPLLLFFNIDYDNKNLYIIKFNLLSDKFFNIDIEKNKFFKTLNLFKKIMNN